MCSWSMVRPESRKPCPLDRLFIDWLGSCARWLSSSLSGMKNYAPIARIILRYIVGAGIMGSSQIGEQIAADPDLVFYASMGVGAVVESAYAYSKRKGWSL